MADKKYKILIIDDDDLIREVVKIALSHAQFEALAIEEPKLAQTVVRQSKPDLILLDLYMPEINGLELLRRLRADAATKDIPVIVFTGSGEKIDQVVAEDAGAYEYVRKPVSGEALIAKIRKVLGLK